MTLALTLGWVVLAAFTLVPVVLGGSVAGAIGMFGLAVPLILLPGLFASWHGRAAAWSRLTGVLVMLIATIALGVQLSA